MTTERELIRAQLNQAGELLRKARVELERVAADPALFTPDLIQAARTRLVEAQHHYARLQDSSRAMFS